MLKNIDNNFMLTQSINARDSFSFMAQNNADDKKSKWKVASVEIDKFDEGSGMGDGKAPQKIT